MEPNTTTGHSSSTGRNIVRAARLRPLRSHQRVMEEAGATATDHWAEPSEAQPSSSFWPFSASRLDESDRHQELLAATSEAQANEREAWLELDVARRHRRAARLRAEVAALRADREGWSQARRDGFEYGFRRLDPDATRGEVRFDGRPYNATARPRADQLPAHVQALAGLAVQKMRRVRSTLEQLPPAGQERAVAELRRLEQLLQALGVNVAELLRAG